MGMLQASISLKSSCITSGGAAYLKSVPSTCHIFSKRVPKCEDKHIPGKLIFGDTPQYARNSYHRKLIPKASALLTVPFSQAAKAPVKYLFRTEKGDLVKVSIEKKNGKYSIYIKVLSVQLDIAEDDQLVLSWGIYRSDSSSLIPLTSDDHTRCAANMMTETPFRLTSKGRYEVKLELGSYMAPFNFSFVLKAGILEIKSHRRTNFCAPVGFSSGSPYPLGFSFSSHGVMNFAFFSRTVDSVCLCFYSDNKVEEPALEIELDPYVNRTGDIWHASFDSASEHVSYAYRIIRDTTIGGKNKVILDPYAKVITKSIHDIPGLAKLCRIPAFDWSGDTHPRLPMEELIVYRLNVLNFSRDKSSKLPPKYAGTFAGVTEKLHHFKNLGVNAILLEPVFPFDERKGPYYPSHLFSPANLYGPFGDYRSAFVSMKEMVKSMHANGIEVHLEVEFSHTASSLLPESEHLSYRNCNYPVVQQLILDSLRYWVTEFHIDGFCFVNASYMLRGYDGESLSRPPLVEAISFDPLLSKTKIVADLWDPQDSASEQTKFPHWKRWAEVNAKFCSDVRNFLRGKALIGDLATRLCGSADIFSSGRGPAFSFNFISRNSGLPLLDLVSFSKEELALELSWNCGEEGPTDKKDVLGRRIKQIRNFLFTLYISLGVPLLNMGDEAGQSSCGLLAHADRLPLNWKAINTAFGMQITQFISFLTSLRKRRGDLLQKRSFLTEKDVDWHANDLSLPRWKDKSAKFLAMTLKPQVQETSHLKGNLYAAFNASNCSEDVTLPLLLTGMRWVRLVDTALLFPGFFSSDGEPVLEQTPGLVTYEVKSHSCVLFEAQMLLD